MELTSEQIEERKHYIGGSDVSAILGYSPFSSASEFYKNSLDIYNEKLGLVPRKPSTIKQLMGHAAEPIIAAKFARYNGVEVLQSMNTVYHPTKAYLAGNMDYYIGETAILECKRVGNSMKWSLNPVSGRTDFMLQCQYYMHLTDLREAHLAICVDDADDLQTHKFSYDADLCETIEAVLDNFWLNHVLKKIPPAPTTEKQLRVAYPQSVEKVIFDEEVIETAYMLDKTEDLAAELRVKLIKSMGEADTLCDVVGKRLYTYKSDKNGRRSLRRMR